MSQIRVLVVDDDPWILRMVSSSLEKKGTYAVETARDGQQAFYKAQAQRPDMIISDVMMPVMDGWALVQQLRADPELADIPVLFLTALGKDEDRLRALGLKPDDYVSKPFRFDDLERRVLKALATRKNKSEESRPASPPAGGAHGGGYAPTAQPGFDQQGFGAAPGTQRQGFHPGNFGPQPTQPNSFPQQGGYGPGGFPQQPPGGFPQQPPPRQPPGGFPQQPQQPPQPQQPQQPQHGYGPPGQYPGQPGQGPGGYPQQGGYGPPGQYPGQHQQQPPHQPQQQQPGPGGYPPQHGYDPNSGYGPPGQQAPAQQQPPPSAAPAPEPEQAVPAAVDPGASGSFSGGIRRTGLSGRLEQLGLSSLLVMMEMERKDGVLQLQHATDKNVGRIFIRKGQVIQARIDKGEGPRKGAKSVYYMLTWAKGRFHFTAMDIDMEDEVQTSTTSLLMEGARLIDEANR